MWGCELVSQANLVRKISGVRCILVGVRHLSCTSRLERAVFVSSAIWAVLWVLDLRLFEQLELVGFLESVF